MAKGPKVPKDLNKDPAFMQWFAGSKVVDQRGNPEVCYHGSPFAGFTKFVMNPPKRFTPHYSASVGIWFTPTPSVSAAFIETDYYDETIDKIVNKKGAIYPTFLSIQNPMVFTFGDFKDIKYDGPHATDHSIQIPKKPETFGDPFEIFMDYRDQFAEHVAMDGFGPGRWRLNKEESNSSEASAALVAHLKDKGHDGVMIIGTRYDAGNRGKEVKKEKKANQYIVFEPKQIKSIYNKGTWDPNSDDIGEDMKNIMSLDDFLDQNTRLSQR